jgi:hypothetical protein
MIRKAKNAARHKDNPDFQHDSFQSIFNTAEKMKRRFDIKVKEAIRASR